MRSNYNAGKGEAQAWADAEAACPEPPAGADAEDPWPAPWPPPSPRNSPKMPAGFARKLLASCPPASPPKKWEPIPITSLKPSRKPVAAQAVRHAAKHRIRVSLTADVIFPMQ
ncbi:UNVERIFIED_CONTAM: hypothetical protein PYX00_002142 [Menopon gallinae]|uniref:Uncharacterized protein n=1 Tax=Menopon gallinae TaxID=328185 RepID=A0AAW2IHS7_9NEOP